MVINVREAGGGGVSVQAENIDLTTERTCTYNEGYKKLKEVEFVDLGDTVGSISVKAKWWAKNTGGVGFDTFVYKNGSKISSFYRTTSTSYVRFSYTSSSTFSVGDKWQLYGKQWTDGKIGYVRDVFVMKWMDKVDGTFWNLVD